MKLSTKRWWFTPPDPDDLFFVNIRETFQAIFKCKHEWYYKTNICNRKACGLNKYRRYCKICNKEQHLVYRRCGKIKTEWEDA